MKGNMSQKKARDVDGCELVVGCNVILLSIPHGLTDGLPSPDVIAITEQIGSKVRVDSITSNELVEVDFFDKFGDYHSIWVEPYHLKATLA